MLDDFEYNPAQDVSVPAGGSVDVPIVFEGTAEGSIAVYVNSPEVTGVFAGASLEHQHTATAGELVADLTHPSDGVLTLSNPGTTAAKARVTVQILTRRHLALSVSKISVDPGVPEPFEVTISEPAPGDAVVAELQDPSGARTPITVAPDGSGRWVGQAVSSARGENEIHAWTTTNGTRYAVGSFYVTSGTVSVAPGFRERLIPGTGDLASSLVLTPTITVTEAGEYDIAGTLADASGHEIAIAPRPRRAFVPGPNAVDLVFDGRDIYKSGVSGPYHLVKVIVHRVTPVTLLPEATVEDLGATAAYDYRQFEH